MAAIQTTNLTKRFGDVLAVDDVSLHVDDGEIFGFLGPNGAGKSTTINMLLDFHRPTSGSASVLGYDSQTETSEIRKRVGVLPDAIELYDRLTAFEHLRLCTRMKNTDDDPEAILKKVGLADEGDRKAGGFSTGMQQRLLLGMALIGSPELIILDEPSSGLDPNGIQHMRELLREQAAGGTTVFFSSHILSEVEAVCDRVAIMHQGRLVVSDRIANLRERAGTGGTVTITVEQLPADFDIASIDNVIPINVSERTVQANCLTGAAKVALIDHVMDVASVSDIVAKESSLEDLFNTFTGGGRDGLPADTSGEAATGATPSEGLS